jgi:hypothetical protein
LSLFEAAHGWRYQLLATNTPATTAQFLEARHRPHARVEDTIRTAKHTGLGHLPPSIEINRAWCVAATIAAGLLCWLRLLCLDGPLATAEPKTLRYQLLHTAARIIRGQRKRKIRIPATWPWANQLALLPRGVRFAPTDPTLINASPLPTKGTIPAPVEPGADPTRQSDQQPQPHLDNQIN